MKRSKLIVGSLLLTSLAMGQEGEVTQDDNAATEQTDVDETIEIDADGDVDAADEDVGAAVDDAIEVDTDEPSGVDTQDETVDTPAAGPKTEKITVTGSRIKRIDLEGAQNVTRFSRDDIDNSSFSTVADFIQNNIPSGAFTNENFTLSQVAGSSSFGGRDQTAEYTLVLVNGRRLPTNAIASSFTDLNLIPLAAVENIEYLTSGASAIYGSDAVAGVLNIILKKNFDGTSVRTRFGQAEEGDANTTSVQIVSGTTAENSNFILAYDYFRREPVNAINRPLINSAISPLGDDQRSPNGLPGYVILEDGTRVPFDDCPAADRDIPFSGACAYDFAPLYQVIPQTERNSFYATFNQDLTSNLSIFAEGRYSRVYTKTENGAAPGGVPLAADAPTNPYGQDVTLVRRYIDFGPRAKDNLNEVFSTAAGVSGYFGDTWSWDFVYSNHKLRNTQIGAGGQINEVKASEYFNDGTLDPFAFNVFDTDEKRLAAEDIDAEIFREGSSKLETYNLSFGGELPLLLPGGNVAIATGVEYRDEEFLDRSDIASSAGDILGSAGGNAGGKRNNKAVYLEFAMPVVDLLDISLAARHDILNGNKDATTYAASASLKPIEELLFRASYGTGFKAPALHDLYLERSFGVSTTVDQKLCNDEGSCETIEVNTETFGNTDLDPETSAYLNIGAVYQVNQDISFNLDYWTLQIEDKVAALNATFILQNEAEYADLVQRVNGVLTVPDARVLTPLDNVSEQESSGIEAGFSITNRTSVGKFSTNLLLNKLLVSKAPQGPGEPLCDYADRNLGVNGNLKSNWNQSAFGASLALRYFGAYKTYEGAYVTGTCDNSAAVEDSAFTVDPYYEIDLGATYVINSMFDVGVGIQNVLDEDPSFDKNGVFSDGNVRGWPFYDQQRASNIGRFFYMTLNANLN